MKQQRGAAILTAMLLVALVTVLISTAFWLQWRAFQTESLFRTRVQSQWLHQGAIDWARSVLSEDARVSIVDHLGEPWGVLLQDTALSDFISSSAEQEPEIQNTSLSGHISDLQSRLNVFNLVQDGKIHVPTLQAFRRLFVLLQLPEHELVTMVEKLQAALATPSDSTVKPVGKTGRPLLPRSTFHLGWLGLSAHTITRMMDHVVILPERTQVNLNTASSLVLQASIPGLNLGGASHLIQLRTQKFFRSVPEILQISGFAGLSLNAEMHSVNTRYFEVITLLNLRGVSTQIRTRLLRDGQRVKVLWIAREGTKISSLR